MNVILSMENDEDTCTIYWATYWMVEDMSTDDDEMLEDEEQEADKLPEMSPMLIRMNAILQ